MDIVTTFLRAVERHGERPFLIDENSSINYVDADRRTDAIAKEFMERGISPGDIVGFSASDRVSLWLGVIGSWKAGATPALIDSLVVGDRLPYFVNDVGATLVAAAPERVDELSAAGAAAVVDLDSLGEGGGNSVNVHGPDSRTYLSYTSGTTGDPKGALLASAEPTLATSCIADRLGLVRDDVILATTPIPSSFQLVAALMPAIHAGAAVVLVAGRPVSEMWDMAVTTGATVLSAYPLTLADFVNEPRASKDSTFRVALSGGSPLAPRIKRDYLDKLGVNLLESYGQSELGGFMAMGSPDDGQRALEGYVGRSLPDRLAFVGGSDFQELPAGETGEVLVTHGYFPAYANKPDKYKEATAGGVLHTGDLAISDPDGFLKVLGRTGEAPAAARRGGFLRELEDALYSHPAVLHAAVVERTDGALVGFYQTQDGASLESQDLLDHAGSQVSAALLPESMTNLDVVPRTFSGKADRLGLVNSLQ